MEFTPHDMAHGGSAIARIDGKAFFVDGVMPGETAIGEIEVDKGSWGRISSWETWLVAFVVAGISWWLGAWVFARYRDTLVEAV